MSLFNYLNSSMSGGETTTQKAYTIGGVPIMFPYKAYPSQITMMDKIIKCLNKKHNCLLESPTGSGKSLALLCAALAWLKKTEKQIRETEQLLDQHLNAYGVTVSDGSSSVEKQSSMAVNFEKYKFTNKQNETTDTNIKEPEESSSDVKIESKYFCGNKCGESSCSVNVENKNSSLRDSVIDSVISKYEQRLSSKDLNGKKRGIVYIDDKDIEDFQPQKRNKIFSSPSCNQFSSIPVEKPVIFSPDASKQAVKSLDSSPKAAKFGSSNPENSPCAKKIIENDNTNTLPSKLPKIFFGTRTHKQIGQIIRELKKTPYKDVKMTILSSRERTCIHPKNSKSKNKNEGCDELIRRDNGPACEYYKNIRRVCYYHPPEMSTAFDLEDFISICRQKRICPYFGARELLQSSEIVFCPYNYLVDPLIRSALSICLKGNIVIMDEAHNIEDSARDAANRRISVSQLQEAISDILQTSQLRDDDSEHYKHNAKVLENLKKWLESSHDLKDYVSFDSSAKVWSGNEMIAVLDYVGLGPDTFPIFLKNYEKIYREEKENETEKTKSEDFKDPKLSGQTHMCLRGLTETLNYLYKDKLRYIPDFRFVIMKSKAHTDEASLIPASQSSKKRLFSSYSSVFEITVNFWCLNPAVVFSDMKDVIHSLIVASGTLAPLASFQSELGLPFQITLEANHVISRENLWVGTIGRGPSNNCLSGTFHNASTFAYQDDIGNIVFEICSIVPHGVLCFLPSYSMLDKLVNRWKLTGLFDKLLGKKVVCCEPRRANEDFQQIIQEFYDAVEDTKDNLCNNINGALLLAVCRGKVSEGLDFADNNARAVITVGIPFPNIKDAQVDLKKRYNDLFSSQRPIVSGSEWYEMQAFRALNQALGRCIRHRNDFGALIIVDERFQKFNRYIGALSKWIKRDVEHFPTFGDAVNSLCKFTERMGLKDNVQTVELNEQL